MIRAIKLFDSKITRIIAVDTSDFENRDASNFEVITFFPVILIGYAYGKICRWFSVGKQLGEL